MKQRFSSLLVLRQLFSVPVQIVNFYHTTLPCHHGSNFRPHAIRCFNHPKFQAKDPLNGASAGGTGGESSARAFLSSGKREVSREYPSFAAGLHSLPPTPASPFPHGASNPFNPANKGKFVYSHLFRIMY